MSDAGISYLTTELDRVIDYCIDEFDMNYAEVLGALRLAMVGIEMDCMAQHCAMESDEEDSD